MTSTTTELVPPADDADAGRWRSIVDRSPATRLILAGVVLLALLSLTRVIADADDLTSSGTIGTTARLTIPILLAESEASGKLKAGMKVAMIAFGSGFTWGAVIADW